ncbi:hypothetical protein WJ22_24450 [Burkholderia vietnamiensis]|nr:hypothetical protein WL96_03120 [Burkholderia vietnamiensis]KVE59641.1 hypothetical protein WI96_28415 [Burkholderia vietnamiensis]KVF88288.1 hypothetical protein WJ19_00275 [Burkholderia vietnamiensis]KVF90902.1 hypothetical protein WJ20_00340 [Burkholderia vietnamiensis]KVF97233.1 hypothetical protein WJ22_24450 [Burkholderia vietnamiensis]
MEIEWSTWMQQAGQTRSARWVQGSGEDVMMRSVLEHARRNMPLRDEVVNRARAAARSLGPLAYAYLADRAYGG